LVNGWAQECIGKRGLSAVGAVVGATWPEQVQRLREKMARSIFLLPGYGAQGAGAKECAPAFQDHPFGAIVNSSRGIIFAHERFTDLSWDLAAARAAAEMRDELQAVRDSA
jgi:orotidine-5'-phosphate decarboxylase